MFFYHTTYRNYSSSIKSLSASFLPASISVALHVLRRGNRSVRRSQRMRQHSSFIVGRFFVWRVRCCPVVCAGNVLTNTGSIMQRAWPPDLITVFRRGAMILIMPNESAKPALGKGNDEMTRVKRADGKNDKTSSLGVFTHKERNNTVAFPLHRSRG